MRCGSTTLTDKSPQFGEEEEECDLQAQSSIPLQECKASPYCEHYQLHKHFGPLDWIGSDRNGILSIGKVGGGGLH